LTSVCNGSAQSSSPQKSAPETPHVFFLTVTGVSSGNHRRWPAWSFAADAKLSAGFPRRTGSTALIYGPLLAIATPSMVDLFRPITRSLAVYGEICRGNPLLFLLSRMIAGAADNHGRACSLRTADQRACTGCMIVCPGNLSRASGRTSSTSEFQLPVAILNDKRDQRGLATGLPRIQWPSAGWTS